MSCPLIVPSCHCLNIASTGFVTTSYGLKYEKLIALPTPSFHLLIGIICALFSHGADRLLLYASISSIVTPVRACAVLLTAVPVPDNVTYAPNNLLRPICLNLGLADVASFAPNSIMLYVVLIISAGKDTKLPNGNFLID